MLFESPIGNGNAKRKIHPANLNEQKSNQHNKRAKKKGSISDAQSKSRRSKSKKTFSKSLMFASPESNSRKKHKDCSTPNSMKSPMFGSPSYFDQYSNLPSNLYQPNEMTRDGNFTGDMILLPQMGRGGEEVSFLM